MNRKFIACMTLVALTSSLVTIALSARSTNAAPQDAPAPMGEMTPEMIEGFQRYMEMCRPSDAHEYLEQFIGDWTYEMSTSMSQPGAPKDSGTATYRWLHEGRWLIREGKGSMMGMPIESTTIIGYDNYKKRYVTVDVNSMTTAMLTSEGDLDRTKKHMLTFGTLDEPITLEHDKRAKYVMRVHSPKKHSLEIHDLMIGETNAVTKVVEMTFTKVEKK